MQVARIPLEIMNPQEVNIGVIKFNPFFFRDQTMKIYDNFEGFPLNSALFGLAI